MATIDLNLLRAFTAVYELKSFSLAGARLGQPRSTLSRAVSALEEELKMRLFHRTTRSVAPTTAGDDLYARTSPSIRALETSLRELPQEAPSGVLRITTTADVGSMVLAEATARYTTLYPNVTVEAHLTSQVVDLVADGFDLAIRVVAKLPSSTLIARKIGALTVRLFASPTYLARMGTPRTIADLQAHDIIGFRNLTQWEMQNGKKRTSFSKAPRVAHDDAAFGREVAKAGAGIAPLPTFLTTKEIAAGTLVRVLPEWESRTGTVFIVQPSLQHRAPRVTAFVALLEELLRQRPL